MMKQARLYMLLREPLLHFLVIGAGLFILFGQTSDPEAGVDRRITITQADLDRLANTWIKGTGRPPSAQEREQQLNHYIREQVLYREAMAMGLDEDDVVVRRRLAKKMEFLFDDLSIIPEPTEAELTLFLSEHPEKFTWPAALSFSQIYLDPARRNQALDEDAIQLLEQLNEAISVADAVALGDRSLLPHDFTNQRKSEIAGLFGAGFAQQVFLLPVDGWHGPVTSEYGLHLVYVHSRTEARLPPLDEIRERVASEWRAMKQHEANGIFYQSLHQRYEIVLEVDTAKGVMASAEQ